MALPPPVQRAVASLSKWLQLLTARMLDLPRSNLRKGGSARGAGRKRRSRYLNAASPTLAPFITTNTAEDVPRRYAALDRVSIEDTLSDAVAAVAAAEAFASEATALANGEADAGEPQLRTSGPSPPPSLRAGFSSLLATSNLLEPTFEQLVVIWRPMRPRVTKRERLRRRIRRVLRPAQGETPLAWVVLGPIARALPLPARLQLPPPPPPPPLPPPLPLELRVFTDVPMANFGAVLPGNRLVFSPAEALRLDSISVATLLAALIRIRTSLHVNYKLLGSLTVGLWIVRTLLAYRNNLIRFDRNALRLLTSKTLVRSSSSRPVFRYIAQEAAMQRAYKAELLLSWLRRQRLSGGGGAASESELQARADELVAAYSHSSSASTPVDVSVSEAVAELRRLGLVEIRHEDAAGGEASGEMEGRMTIVELLPDEAIEAALGRHWASLLRSS